MPVIRKSALRFPQEYQGPTEVFQVHICRGYPLPTKTHTSNRRLSVTVLPASSGDRWTQGIPSVLPQSAATESAPVSHPSDRE